MASENATAEEMLVEVIEERDQARLALRDARARIASDAAEIARLRAALQWIGNHHLQEANGIAENRLDPQSGVACVRCAREALAVSGPL